MFSSKKRMKARTILYLFIYISGISKDIIFIYIYNIYIYNIYIYIIFIYIYNIYIYIYYIYIYLNL